MISARKQAKPRITRNRSYESAPITADARIHNKFVSRYSALAFLPGDHDRRALYRHLERLITTGISEYRVISLSPLADSLQSELQSIHPNIKTIEVTTVTDALKVASADTTNRH